MYKIMLKKSIKILTTLAVILVMMTGLFPGMEYKVMAAGEDTVLLPVAQTASGYQSETAAAKYVLTAETTGAPMPAGSSGSKYEFEITGTKTEELSFTVTGEGEWNYTLSASTDSGTISPEEKAIKVYGLNSGGGLYAYVFAYDDNGKKIDLDFQLEKKSTEEKTITRTIIFVEKTDSGETVIKTVKQPVTLERDITGVDASGNPVYGPWKIKSGEYGSVDVDDKTGEGWTADRSSIPKWDIDLTDPKDVTEKVTYSRSDITEIEEMTVTRTITYTENTVDGNNIAKSITQTVKLERTKITNPDTGKITYSDWNIVSGDYGLVRSPEIDGWTPDIESVPIWKIDLKNPQDSVVHVVYSKNDELATEKHEETTKESEQADSNDPANSLTTTTRIIKTSEKTTTVSAQTMTKASQKSSKVKTGDDTNVISYVICIAVAAFIILFIIRYRRQKD